MIGAFFAPMIFHGRLALSEVTLPPAGEWRPAPAEWLFARVAEGFGYCFADSAAHELGTGDAVLLARPGEGEFRASQLAAMKLVHFSLNTDRLSNLISLPERQRILGQATARPRVRVYPADQPVARRLKLSSEPVACTSSFRGRLRLLELFSAALGEEFWLETRQDDRLRLVGARERFQDLVNELTEAEFWSAPLDELAAHCGCGLRHFSRLFQELFGQSLRACQIDYRLKRARQLLENSNSKIGDIALECGYRHLGLFHTVFKDRFGVTPAAWRKQVWERRQTAAEGSRI